MLTLYSWSLFHSFNTQTHTPQKSSSTTLFPIFFLPFVLFIHTMIFSSSLFYMNACVYAKGTNQSFWLTLTTINTIYTTTATTTQLYNVRLKTSLHTFFFSLPPSFKFYFTCKVHHTSPANVFLCIWFHIIFCPFVWNRNCEPLSSTNKII